MNICDCIFYSYYRNHGASVPVCTRFSSDLVGAINDLSVRCPCVNFITRSVVSDLQDSGDIYTDYRCLLSDE